MDSLLEGDGFELPVPRKLGLCRGRRLALHLGSLNAPAARPIEFANCPKRVHRGARLGLGDSVPSDFSYTPCSVMSMSKGGSVPQLRWSSVSRAASDRTDAVAAAQDRARRVVGIARAGHVWLVRLLPGMAGAVGARHLVHPMVQPGVPFRRHF